MGAIQEEHDHKDVVNEPVDNAEAGDLVVDPMSDEAAEPTQDVDTVLEPSDHGLYEDPLVGSQYTSEGKDYPLEAYKEYSDDGDGEWMMVICEDHLQYVADGAFPIVVEDSNIEPSEPDDSDAIEQRIQSICVWQDTGWTAKQTTTVIRKLSASMMCPKRPASQIWPLVAKMMINGLDAIVMFDTGSTSDAVSPEFARVVNMKIHSLDEQLGIQLGCKGSKSKIVFGTSGPVWYSSIVGTHYFDVVNIDQFDTIISMGFMHKFGITLEPKHDSILISRIPAPTLSEGEETAELVCRHWLQHTQPISHWHEEVGPLGSAEKGQSVHIEEIEDEDAPCRNIWVLRTTNHSCLKLTKIEPPKSTWQAMTVEVVDNEDTLKECKG